MELSVLGRAAHTVCDEIDGAGLSPKRLGTTFHMAIPVHTRVSLTAKPFHQMERRRATKPMQQPAACRPV